MKIFFASIILSLSAFLAHAADYSVGQVWKYKTRPGEEASRLQINRIEEIDGQGVVYHVSLLSVRMPNLQTGEKFTTDFPHLPVSETSLNNSVVSLTGEQANSVDFEQGYENWKQANGGVFTITLAECIEVIEQSLRGIGDEL